MATGNEGISIAGGFAHAGADLQILEKKVSSMDKWTCSICGYVYDPAAGDPDSGVAPNTPFESLPDDWSCPICGVSKENFEKQ
jgi:rubredoxin